jgi:hypothetical protein
VIRLLVVSLALALTSYILGVLFDAPRPSDLAVVSFVASAAGFATARADKALARVEALEARLRAAEDRAAVASYGAEMGPLG